MSRRVGITHIASLGLFLVVLCGLVCLVDWAGLPNEQGDERVAPKRTARDGPGAIVHQGPIEDGGLGIASQFTAPIHDRGSLDELREAIEVRGPLGLAVLQAELEQTRLRFRAPREEVAAAARLSEHFGLLNLYQGRHPEAAASFQRALELGRPSDLPEPDRARLVALLGIVALRRGELDDRAEPGSGSSDIFPIAPDAVHSGQQGAREAIDRFMTYLQRRPHDLSVRWLLNLAYMRLGEYPDRVPQPHLVPLDSFRSSRDVGRFEEVASRAGLHSRGPNMAGGSVFDDFNEDGLPDLFVTSLDVNRGASLFVNRGDGSFLDCSIQAGLGGQIHVMNLTHADCDNDGDLDVVLLRGAGENPERLSLLLNNGDGTFEDVTIASGLDEPIATGAAAWGDYDNDGRLDLFVCGEYRPGTNDTPDGRPDPRNRCRLYHNRGEGRFRDAALVAGVVNDRCACGAAWGDFDADGLLDLFVANADGAARLFHNQGDGTFRDAAVTLGLSGLESGHACFFWDYDNDGRLDIFVTDDRARPAEFVAAALGLPVENASHPRLFRNLGGSGFGEVTRDVGLDRPLPTLGCNFGDVDNDGYLDLYIGAGWRGTSSLVPGRMFLNAGGLRFEDVTLSSRTGHVRNGQGVSFADLDGDGDLDFFVQAGGLVPASQSHNLLFHNPGHGRHWLKIRLVGTRTNGSALGARICVKTAAPDGKNRTIHRTVGNNSSFGGNSLVQSIGLLDASRVAELTITWSASRTTQTFRDLDADREIVITEGVDAYRVVTARRDAVPRRFPETPPKRRFAPCR
jgi:hypothetical protein